MLLERSASLVKTGFKSICRTIEPDLEIPAWETSDRLPDLASKYFETYQVRPRNSNVPFSFALKTLKAQYRHPEIGAALIERERFLGAIPSRRLAPVVDYSVPQLYPNGRASIGYVVSPIFSGRVLNDLALFQLNAPKLNKRVAKRQISELLDDLSANGWTLDNVQPEHILIANSDDPLNFNIMLIDVDSARRYGSPSLFVHANDDETLVFDPNFQLKPDAFYSSAASVERAAKRLYGLLKPFCE